MDKKLLDTAIRDGKIQERFRIAQNLIYNGIDIDSVCYFTNLSRRKAAMIYEYYHQKRHFYTSDTFVMPDTSNSNASHDSSIY